MVIASFFLSHWGVVAKYVIIIFLDAAIVYLEAHSVFFLMIIPFSMTSWRSQTLFMYNIQTRKALNLLILRMVAMLRIFGTTSIILLSVLKVCLKSTLAIRAWFHIFQCVLVIAHTSQVFLCFGIRWGRFLLTESLLLITPGIITLQINRRNLVSLFSNLMLRRATVPRLVNLPRISCVVVQHLAWSSFSIVSGGLSYELSNLRCIFVSGLHLSCILLFQKFHKMAKHFLSHTINLLLGLCFELLEIEFHVFYYVEVLFGQELAPQFPQIYFLLFQLNISRHQSLR